MIQSNDKWAQNISKTFYWYSFVFLTDYVTLLTFSKTLNYLDRNKRVHATGFCSMTCRQILKYSVYYHMHLLFFRRDANVEGIFRFDSPATSERIRLACVDQFTRQVSFQEAFYCVRVLSVRTLFSPTTNCKLLDSLAVKNRSYSYFCNG